MKIAINCHLQLVECNASTPQSVYHCLMCGASVFPCNQKKKEDGRVKDYYFSHFSDCTGAVESYIHKIAKKIISENQRIALPDFVLNYSKVELESRSLHDALQPDAVLDMKIAIEIYYTNPKTDKHKGLYRSLNLTAVEIDLSKLNLTSTLPEIQDAVLNDEDNREYLSQRLSENSTENPGNSFWMWFGIVFTLLFGLNKLRQYISRMTRRRKRR